MDIYVTPQRVYEDVYSGSNQYNATKQHVSEALSILISLKKEVRNFNAKTPKEYIHVHTGNIVI